VTTVSVAPVKSATVVRTSEVPAVLTDEERVLLKRLQDALELLEDLERKDREEEKKHFYDFSKPI
jgi:hypothetical protein